MGVSFIFLPKRLEPAFPAFKHIEWLLHYPPLPQGAGIRVYFYSHFTVSKPSPGRSASCSHPGSAHQAQCFLNLSVQMSHLEVLIPQVWAEIWDSAFFHTLPGALVLTHVGFTLSGGLCSIGLWAHQPGAVLYGPPSPSCVHCNETNRKCQLNARQSKSKTSTQSHTPNFS